MDYVCVIGGANIDLIGTPNTKLQTFDSNPGKLRITFGGVGRNIAENLKRLGQNVIFITAFGEDLYASHLKASLEGIGIDISHSVTVENGNSSIYMCLNDEHNDMFVGLSDMEILDAITPEYLAEKLDVINGAKCVVADTNIPNCLDFLRKNVIKPLFVDTVSAKKTALVADKLTDVFCLKPNVYEAEILSGIKISSEEDIEKAIKIIRANGVKEVVVTLGDKGSFCGDVSGFSKIPSFKADVVSTTGAGDSFVAGLVAGFCEGLTLEERARFASAVAAITVSDEKTVSERVTKQNVEKILKGENL